MSSILEQAAPCIETADFERLAEILEDFLVDQNAHPDNWCLLVLAHLSNGHQQYARFVCKRAPSEVQDSEVFRACVNLVKVLWNKEYALAWPILNSTEWPEPLRGAIAHFDCFLRNEAENFIARAYCTVKKASAAAILGRSDANLFSDAQRLGWQYDAASEVFKLHDLERSKAAEKIDLTQLNRVTTQIISLTS